MLQARVGFAVRPLPAGSKRSEIALPATTSGRTSPAGPGGLSSFGALGRVSQSGRFRSRAWDPRPRRVRGSTLPRPEASGPGPAAAGRSTGSFTGPANRLSRTPPPAWRRTTPDPSQRERSLPAGRRDSSRGKSRPDTPCVAFSPCVEARLNRGIVSICGTAPFTLYEFTERGFTVLLVIKPLKKFKRL